MKRNVSIEEISDGRLYDVNDMVKAGCNDCKGCSACCHGMGNSVVLDPYDMYRLTKLLNTDFTSLMNSKKITLSVIDGTILPSMSMEGNDEACVYLNEQGRCSIYDARPSICRIFPLGRYYTEGSFKYILQIHECAKKNRTKVKVKDFISVKNIKEDAEFINRWHYFLEAVQGRIKGITEDKAKAVILQILNLFYVTAYDFEKDFYGQFYERLDRIEEFF